MPDPLQILGFGAISVDDILYVDRPLNSEKARVINRMTDHGGNVATALVAAAVLGGRAGFIGWLRGPSPDDASTAELLAHGVDISFAPRRPDAGPIRSVITVGPDGDRFIAYDDAVPIGTSDELPDEVLAQAQVLLIDGYAVHSTAVVTRARKLGLAIVADIEWTVGAATDALLTVADHLVLPFEFARTLTGESDPATILQALGSPDRSAVVLTRGDQGTFVWQSGDAVLWHIPAHQVQAVDTTGAGDCFHGAYAFSLADGKPPLDCALFANMAAAISVTGHGGRKALPDLVACLSGLAAAGAPKPVPIGAATV